MAGRRIEVQKPPTKKRGRHDSLKILAEFCWHYPQYTLAQARKLPYKTVASLLDTARKQEASRMYQLTNIVAAPQTKKGTGVKKLLNHYKGVMDG